MKNKKLILLTALAFVVMAFFVACSGSNKQAAAESETVTESIEATEASETTQNVTLTVGASSTPHAEILEIAKPILADKGIDLNIIIYDDYVLPNTALQDGTLDANYFQHTPYMNSFNESNGTDLVSAGMIHYEPFGIYSFAVKDLNDKEAFKTIIVPDDDSNQTRALLLLRQEGLVDLPEDATVDKGVSVLDIVDDHGYTINAAQADAIPSLLKSGGDDVIAVINYNYALGAGLKTTDALAVEDASGDAARTYANVIAVRRGDEGTPAIRALVSVLQDGIVDKYNNNTGAGIMPIK